MGSLLLASFLYGAGPGALAARPAVSRLALAGLQDIEDVPEGPPHRAPSLGPPGLPPSKQILEVAALVWAALGVMMGGLFASKGHNFFRGLVSGLFLSPLFSFLLYLRLEPDFGRVEARELAGVSGTTVCPYCSAVLEAGEALCPECGKLVPG